MRLKLFDFQKITNRLRNEKDGEVFHTADYFEFYTTGMENLVNENFFATDRLINERSEVLAHNLLGNQDFADVIVAANNDNFLWDAPIDYEKTELVIENRLQTLMKYKQRGLSQIERTYYTDKFKEDLEVVNQDTALVVMPRHNRMQEVLRMYRKYLAARKVK